MFAEASYVGYKTVHTERYGARAANKETKRNRKIKLKV